MSQPYSRVIQAQKPKTSHRDVDKSNEPDNQQFKTGWKTFPVCQKLEQLTEDRWVLQAVSGYKL